MSGWATAATAQRLQHCDDLPHTHATVMTHASRGRLRDGALADTMQTRGRATESPCSTVLPLRARMQVPRTRWCHSQSNDRGTFAERNASDVAGGGRRGRSGGRSSHLSRTQVARTAGQQREETQKCFAHPICWKRAREPSHGHYAVPHAATELLAHPLLAGLLRNRRLHNGLPVEPNGSPGNPPPARCSKGPPPTAPGTGGGGGTAP